MSIQSVNAPTIFIIDDHHEIRLALQWLLESEFFQVETFSCAQSFLNIYEPNKHGCIITDIQMPGIDGLKFLEQLKLENILLPVIVLTAYGDVPMAVSAIKAGALDFFCKPFDSRLFLERVREACSTLKVVDKFSKPSFNLTVRQEQIIKLVVKGKLNKQIANELEISISTVEHHRALAMKKMDVKTLTDLIKKFIDIYE